MLKPQSIVKIPDTIAHHFKIKQRSELVNLYIRQTPDARIVEVGSRAPKKTLKTTMANTAFLIDFDNLNKIRKLQEFHGYDFSLPSLITHVLSKAITAQQETQVG